MPTYIPSDIQWQCTLVSIAMHSHRQIATCNVATYIEHAAGAATPLQPTTLECGIHESRLCLCQNLLRVLV